MALIDRVAVRPRPPHYDPDAWYFGIPAIEEIRTSGLELAPATVIVGENGSGKSTFVEALAAAWRGTRFTNAEVRHWGPTSSAEDSDLGWHLALDGTDPVAHGGCFLRAEAMHRLFSEVDSAAEETRAFGGSLNALSHGEGFLAFLESRTTERGVFILDEPEAALSFTSCLRLLSLLDILVKGGSQVVMATHSPVLASLPGASIIEFGEDGISRSEWADLELVQHWQTFMARPGLYLRHLTEDPPD